MYENFDNLILTNPNQLGGKDSFNRYKLPGIFLTITVHKLQITIMHRNDKFLSSFTFKSSKLEGRGPGFLLGTLLFCLGELAADVGVLLFKVFSGEFPLLLCLSFSGLQVIGKRGTRMSMLN